MLGVRSPAAATHLRAQLIKVRGCHSGDEHARHEKDHSNPDRLTDDVAQLDVVAVRHREQNQSHGNEHCYDEFEHLACSRTTTASPLGPASAAGSLPSCW